MEFVHFDDGLLAPIPVAHKLSNLGFVSHSGKADCVLGNPIRLGVEQARIAYCSIGNELARLGVGKEAITE